MISVGVHMYVYVFTKKNFFGILLVIKLPFQTLAVDSCRIYTLASPLHSPETLFIKQSENFLLIHIIFFLSDGCCCCNNYGGTSSLVKYRHTAKHSPKVKTTVRKLNIGRV